MNLVIKDAIWQIFWRVASAVWWFLVIKLITPYLWPLRFGDYSTILKYFAIRSALADFGLYVLALKTLWSLDKHDTQTLSTVYGKFVSTRWLMIIVIYMLALVLAYLIPAYTSNIYLMRWIPLGMMFSASFMSAWILQLPLQLSWKMEQLSIGLIVARITQLALIGIVIYWAYPLARWAEPTLASFLWIVCSVLLSGVTQGAYVFRQSQRYLKLHRSWDRSFTKDLLQGNRQYGLAYFLSSFHTLVVLILLSWFYPTALGYTLVWVWALALSLLEILLIVPSSLGNSMIHHVAAASPEVKRKHFGHLCMLVTWIGCVVFVLFWLFAPHLIEFIWWSAYLSADGRIGSDWVLKWIGLVVLMSFIKQVHNYLFVSTGDQNILLPINLLGVGIGLPAAVLLIDRFELVWWLRAQWILEFLFLAGAVAVARYKRIPLTVPIVQLTALLLVPVAVILFVPQTLFAGSVGVHWLWIAQWWAVTAALTALSYKFLKVHAKGL